MYEANVLLQMKYLFRLMEVAAVANKSKLAHTTTRKVRSLSQQLSYCQCRVACVVWLNRQLLTNSRVHALGVSPDSWLRAVTLWVTIVRGAVRGTITVWGLVAMV